MTRYRKKPVVVDATEYEVGMEDGFMLVTRSADSCLISHDTKARMPYIHTLEGNMRVNEGDMIITGVRGERYPCNLDIFEETYEVVK